MFENHKNHEKPDKPNEHDKNNGRGGLSNKSYEQLTHFGEMGKDTNSELSWNEKFANNWKQLSKMPFLGSRSASPLFEGKHARAEYENDKRSTDGPSPSKFVKLSFQGTSGSFNRSSSQEIPEQSDDSLHGISSTGEPKDSSNKRSDSDNLSSQQTSSPSYRYSDSSYGSLYDSSLSSLPKRGFDLVDEDSSGKSDSKKPKFSSGESQLEQSGASSPVLVDELTEISSRLSLGSREAHSSSPDEELLKIGKRLDKMDPSFLGELYQDLMKIRGRNLMSGDQEELSNEQLEEILGEIKRKVLSKVNASLDHEDNSQLRSDMVQNLTEKNDVGALITLLEVNHGITKLSRVVNHFDEINKDCVLKIEEDADFFGKLYEDSKIKHNEVLRKYSQKSTSSEQLQQICQDINEYLGEIKQKVSSRIGTTLGHLSKDFIYPGKIQELLKEDAIEDLVTVANWMSDYRGFINEARKCSQKHYSDASFKPENIFWAYVTYLETKHYSGHDFHVIGRWPMRPEIPSTEERPCLDADLMRNILGIRNDTTEQHGTILRSYDPEKSPLPFEPVPFGPWTLLKNDAWMLGAFHANRDINIASGVNNENAWNHERKSMTVKTRELIAAMSSGYQLYATQFEPILRCVDPDIASKATFHRFEEAGKQYNTYEDVINFYSQLEKDIKDIHAQKEKQLAKIFKMIGEVDPLQIYLVKRQKRKEGIASASQQDLGKEKAIRDAYLKLSSSSEAQEVVSAMQEMTKYWKGLDCDGTDQEVRKKIGPFLEAVKTALASVEMDLETFIGEREQVSSAFASTSDNTFGEQRDMQQGMDELNNRQLDVNIPRSGLSGAESERNNLRNFIKNAPKETVKDICHLRNQARGLVNHGWGSSTTDTWAIIADNCDNILFYCDNVPTRTKNNIEKKPERETDVDRDATDAMIELHNIKEGKTIVSIHLNTVINKFTNLGIDFKKIVSAS